MVKYLLISRQNNIKSLFRVTIAHIVDVGYLIIGHLLLMNTHLSNLFHKLLVHLHLLLLIVLSLLLLAFAVILILLSRIWPLLVLFLLAFVVPEKS